MLTTTVNLYEYFGVQPPEGGRGWLECWIPATPEGVGRERRVPAMLVLPGGGYSRTSPRESETVALPFAAAGYAVFSLQYTCAPQPFPVALREAVMAMRYIRENADRWKIHPGMVAAMGFSAGGHLCGTLGTMYDCPEVADLGEAALLRPDALVLCYPVAVSWGSTHEGSFQNVSGGDGELRARLSLDRLVRPDMPPVFLWHTRDDALVPVRNSLILAQALDQAGVDFAMHVYRSGVHGLANADELVYCAGEVPAHSPDADGWLQTAMSFLKELGFGIRDGQRQ